MKPEPGLNIIVADDNVHVALVLSEILSEQGHTVRTAVEGNAVLSRFMDCVPDVLVTDLDMPGMSGVYLIPIVRQRFSGVAIIAMSGAYTADNFPSTVVSDWFYAKDATSIAPLLDMVNRVMDRHGVSCNSRSSQRFLFERCA